MAEGELQPIPPPDQAPPLSPPADASHYPPLLERLYPAASLPVPHSHPSSITGHSENTAAVTRPLYATPGPERVYLYDSGRALSTDTGHQGYSFSVRGHERVILECRVRMREPMPCLCKAQARDMTSAVGWCVQGAGGVLYGCILVIIYLLGTDLHYMWAQSLQMCSMHGWAERYLKVCLHNSRQNLNKEGL